MSRFVSRDAYSCRMLIALLFGIYIIHWLVLVMRQIILPSLYNVTAKFGASGGTALKFESIGIHFMASQFRMDSIPGSLIVVGGTYEPGCRC